MERLIKQKDRLRIDHCIDEFTTLIKDCRKFLNQAKGNILRFKNALESIPDYVPSVCHINEKAITIGQDSDLSFDQRASLKEKLSALCPWRKGPFNFFGIHIDSEWQSWMKWERVIPHISSLKFRRILDVGSSNGYYMFRMAFHKPLMVLGVEPKSAFYFQYLTIQKFLKQDNVFCLPISFDRLPKMNRYFDTIFCMGILYHRKSPVQMLKDMCELMRPGGELIIENLVIRSEKNVCLFPNDRYAKMRNVYFIPDILAMKSWMKRAGFRNIKCVDITRTSLAEQRKTAWIHTETLKDFLDPRDPDKTIEGYPAPVRAIFIATAT